MPYIKEARRGQLEDALQVLETCLGSQQSEGDLNYVLSRLAWSYVCWGSENYSRLSQAIAALECAKLELYRRKVAPYEDKKMAENGDVFDW
jgi:hypothetical protein